MDARMLNSGVAWVLLATSHWKALKVSAKLKMFLKMIMQVNPSMARSPVVVCSCQYFAFQIFSAVVIVGKGNIR